MLGGFGATGTTLRPGTSRDEPGPGEEEGGLLGVQLGARGCAPRVADACPALEARTAAAGEGERPAPAGKPDLGGTEVPAGGTARCCPGDGVSSAESHPEDIVRGHSASCQASPRPGLSASVGLAGGTARGCSPGTTPCPPNGAALACGEQAGPAPLPPAAPSLTPDRRRVGSQAPCEIIQLKSRL